MAISPSALSAALISEINGSASHTGAHDLFTSRLNAYITANIKINGTYSGDAGSGAYAGAYVWSATATLVAANIRAGAAGCQHTYSGGHNIQPYILAMQTEMRNETNIDPADDSGTITQAGTNFTPLVFTLSFSSANWDSQTGAFGVLAQEICNAYWGTTCITVSASSPAGSGTVSWGAVE